jgi:hypothetical protein
MYHFGSLPLQEEKIHASLLVFLHLDPLNVGVDILMKRSAKDLSVGIEQGTGTQIWQCQFNQLSPHVMIRDSGIPPGLEIRVFIITFFAPALFPDLFLSR